MNTSRSFALRCLALGLLSVQAGIDRLVGRPLPLALGVDAPVSAAAAAVEAPAAAAAPAAPAAPATPAVEAAAPTGLAGVLATAFSSVRSRVTVSAELTAARAQIGTLTTERDQARTDLAAANAQVAAAAAQLSAVAAFFGLNPSDLAGKKAAECTALLTQKISAATTEQVASLGFNVGTLPKQADAEGDPKRKTYAEFSALTPAQKMEFSTNGGRIVD